MKTELTRTMNLDDVLFATKTQLEVIRNYFSLLDLKCKGHTDRETLLYLYGALFMEGTISKFDNQLDEIIQVISQSQSVIGELLDIEEQKAKELEQGNKLKRSLLGDDCKYPRKHDNVKR